jgi:hypothetical protein
MDALNVSIRCEVDSTFVSLILPFAKRLSWEWYGGRGQTFMKQLPGTGRLTRKQAGRLRRSVARLMLAMTNSLSLIEAGYVIAVKRPDLVKRIDRPVLAARKKVKPELVIVPLAMLLPLMGPTRLPARMAKGVAANS